jgi:YegS/Rv2252/BmrU family lipid kinase
MTAASPTKPSSVRLIFNPAAKGGKARIFRKHLDEFASFCELRATTGPGDASRLAAQAVTDGCQTVIAAGGDGTIHETLNGIASVPGGLDQTRLGVLPMGTINVFACELGIPPQWKDALKVLREGRERRIDLPCADYSVNGNKERRYFVQLGGVGLDARAVELVEWKLKTKIGPLAYIYAGLKALREKHGLIRIEPVVPESDASAQTSQPVFGEMALMGNGKFYGGKLPFFPKADLSDGVVDVCVFRRLSFAEMARVILGLVGRRPHAWSRAIHLQGREFTLASDQRVAFELDGEFVGALPVRLTVLPQALRVIVPG